MREKAHRLLRDQYIGRVSAAFTLCLHGDLEEFMCEKTVHAFADFLMTECRKGSCTVPAYCFMPDHLHIILTGCSESSDLWKTMVRYKQKTGYWMSSNRSGVRWQKGFYDHVIRADESLQKQIRYLLDNPVRKGIVRSWDEYPYKGAIGYSLEEVLNSIG